MKRILISLFLICLGIGLGGVAAEVHAPGDYKKLNSSCLVCAELDRLLGQYSSLSNENQRLEVVLKISKVIKKITDTKGMPPALFTAIHYSINASVEVLDSDFDSETVVRLLDLRQRFPEQFDYVLWRFPLAPQKRLIERMQAFKSEKLRPNAKIPEAKEVDSAN